MTLYTAEWQDKETINIFSNGRSVGRIVFDTPGIVAFGDADVYADGQQFRVERNGSFYPLTQNGTEVFTAVFEPLWGNLQLRLDNSDTGYDIKGKWFKAGTRLTDSEDNDLVVVKSEPWLVQTMEIQIVDIDISDLMIVATLYHHVRASAAKVMHVVLG
ncbi:hypothetical protein [Flavobacterium silvaticum]|uniref:Uncharacterized protein n=1 Tax=Flavobacterium silvaticum TaxID=1852020 RepID=A0A972JI00_9FLAO|nr:hypothetical protein [Flavobacterium silvaticum]NMH27673.1 hypothetical protein [Flavobacterium silvaticum]